MLADTDERVKLDGLTGGVIEDACRTGDTDERVNLDGLTSQVIVI